MTKNKLVSRFVRSLLIVVASTAALTYGISWFIPEGDMPSIWPVVLLFYGVISFVTFLLTVRSIGERAAVFFNRFMLLTMARLFLLLGLLGLYIFYNRDEAVSFAVLYLVYYLIFSLFEVMTVLPIMRNDNFKK